MKTLVESLKRLNNGSEDFNKKLIELLDSKKITKEEYDYIVGA